MVDQRRLAASRRTGNDIEVGLDFSGALKHFKSLNMDA